MSNLIVTILSIALVAITVVAGLLFLGPSYENYKHQVFANKMIAMGSQINAAGLVYMTDKGQLYYSEDLKMNPNALVPKYLSEVPNILGGAMTLAIQYGGDPIKNNLSCIPAGLPNYFYQLGYRFATDAANRNYVIIFTNNQPPPGGCGQLSSRDAETDTTGAYLKNDPVVNACKIINKGIDTAGLTMDPKTGLPIVASFPYNNSLSPVETIILPEKIKNRCYTYYDTNAHRGIVYAVAN